MDFLKRGLPIAGQYYSELLDRFNEKLKETRPHLAKKKMLFHHDNAPDHSSGNFADILHELRQELLPHSPYSPD